jgi:DNA-binding CsgD family transcriptional regulator
MSGEEMYLALSLIEEAHKAITAEQFRMTLITGIGAMIESVACVWTRLSTDLFHPDGARTNVAEISNDTLEPADVIPIFDAYAWQHPVISQLIKTQPGEALAISDLVAQKAFNQLALYRKLYQPLGIEDQLSAGFVKDGFLTGLSINRATWGFTSKERQLVNRITACTFPFYHTLSQVDDSDPANQPAMQMNIASFENYHEVLGITPRQAQLLTLVAHGKSNPQIAEICCLSEGTVRKHLENCFRRLGVNNRVSAVTTALSSIAK